MTQNSIEAAARAIARARNVVVFTGAGVSRESGIATFRDPEDGLWTRYDALEMATLEGYVRDPAYVWAWYEHRFGTVAAARPNPGHVAIAALERLVPNVVVVTQNIDGLHRRAGSSDVIELHGTMHRFACLHRRHGGYTLEDLADQDERPPRCPECGELIRPDVVWFGEPLPEDELRRAQLLSSGCDAMLVVGTSGAVFPAAALPLYALEAGAVVVDVNPEPSALSSQATVFLKGRGGDILPRLVDEVRSRIVAPEG
jgi:NAD-dependent protein deacetylase/lipoamidase